MHETFRRGGKYSLNRLGTDFFQNDMPTIRRWIASDIVKVETSMQTRYVIAGWLLSCFISVKRNAQFGKFAYCRNENCHGPVETEHEDIVELQTNVERFEPLKLPPVSQERLIEVDKKQIKKKQKPTAGKKLPRKRKEVKKCEIVTWALHYSFCRLLMGRRGHPRDRKQLKQQKSPPERKARNRLTKTGSMYCFTLRILHEVML